MITQVVPFVGLQDFNPETYRKMGFWGATIAISMIIIGFCIVKGHIKLIGCGPNEGGMREFFGIKLWSAGSGPHLHIAGIFAFRKVSFAARLLTFTGVANRDDTVCEYEMGVKVKVLQDKRSIGLRLYQAEDLNRGDLENEEAIKQVESQLRHFARQAFEAGIPADDIPQWMKDRWTILNAREIEGMNAWDEDYGRSTYGYEIVSSEVFLDVQREFSELSGAVRNSEETPVSAIGAAASRRRIFGDRTA